VKRAAQFVAIVFAIAAGVTLVYRPSNARDWSPDQQRLAMATFNGPLVTIQNIRDFEYRSAADYTPRWYDKTFDLRKLESAWFMVEPFGKGAAAHTLVSFGFGGNDFVAISVEIRKEKGESFSALKGLLRQYELMYVVGDERDLIKLRSNHRKDAVYLYPIRTTPEKMRAMFVSMLRRANKLRADPEFYNTLTNTCTTNIVRHVNEISPKRVPFHPAVLLPGHSDRLAYDLGLIDTTSPFPDVRARYHINERAWQYRNDPEWSLRIRGY
jgi:Domain of unknown function (DUF4105)